MTTEQLLQQFPRFCAVTIIPAPDGWFWVRWQYNWRHWENITYLPGSGSYYPLDEALYQAWIQFQMPGIASSNVYTQYMLNDAMAVM